MTKTSNKQSPQDLKPRTHASLSLSPGSETALKRCLESDWLPGSLLAWPIKTWVVVKIMVPFGYPKYKAPY